MCAERRKNEIRSLRGEILRFAAEKYGTQPDYPWSSAPDYAVLRHSDSKKWYGIIMNVPKERLGLSGGGTDILNLKCGPVLSGSLRLSDGFLPAYHMNRENWITVLLDGTVKTDDIFPLLETSYRLTERRGAKKYLRGINKSWLIPANPKYYDLEKAFSESSCISWKQNSNIAEGDTVYIYMTAPVSAVTYKCRAAEVNKPYNYDDGKLRIKRAMSLKLIKRYEPELYTADVLKNHGVYAVRNQRGMPDSLRRKLEDDDTRT